MDRFRPALLILALLPCACGDHSSPDPWLRLADDSRIARVESAHVSLIDSKTPVSAAHVTLDAQAGWRYFSVSRELGGSAADIDFTDYDAQRRERGGAFVPLPPGFGAALWLDIDGWYAARAVGRGTFSGDAGLEVTITALRTPAPSASGSLTPGAIRTALERDAIGRPQPLLPRPQASGDAATADSDRERSARLPRKARSLLVLAVGRESRVEELHEVTVHRVGAFAWQAANGQISRSLVTRVEINATSHPALALPPATRIETAAVEPPDYAMLRFEWAMLADGDASTELRVGVTTGSAPPSWIWHTQIASSSPTWSSVTLPLDEPFEDDVRFVFETGSHSPGTTLPTVYIGAPVVASRTAVSDGLRVLMISLDTLRADRLGCLGNSRNLTPHIDALAADGAVFERAYAQAPYTLPSHTSLFSGMLPDAHGVQTTADRITAGTPLLADELAQAGYATVAYTGGGYISGEFGFSRGFDTFCEVDPIGDRYTPGLVRGGKQYRDGTSGSLRVALDDMRRLAAKKSFVFLHTFMTHCYLPPADLADEFGLRDPQAPPLTFEAARRYEPQEVLEHPLDDPDRRRLIDAYDATVRAADRMVGEVVALLKELDLYDRTVIVVTSDHGQELLDHGLTGHGITLYEELIHVPLVIRVPGRPAGVRVPARVNSIDVLPTLLDLLELAHPAGLQGATLTAALDGEVISDRQVISMVDVATRSSRTAIIENGYKRIESSFAPPMAFRPTAALELYDLDADPDEREDRSAKEPRIANILAERLDHAEAISAQLRQVIQERSAGDTHAPLSSRMEETLRELGYLGGKKHPRKVKTPPTKPR